MRYYKDERTANEVTRSKAKAAASGAWGADAGLAQSSGNEGVISMDSICAVFNEPGKKGGCSIKLIGTKEAQSLSDASTTVFTEKYCCFARVKFRDRTGIQACRTLA